MNADETREPVQLEITFKSGAQITVDVDEWELMKGTGKRLRWNTPEDAKRRLVTFDLDEVTAIVEVRP